MTTDYAEQHREKVLNKYRKAMFDQDFPAAAPMRFKNSQWHYHNTGLHSLVHRGGKEFFLGHEVVVDPFVPSHSIRETVAYSARKYRESQQTPKHPWDLAHVYANGEPFQRFMAGARPERRLTTRELIQQALMCAQHGHWDAARRRLERALHEEQAGISGEEKDLQAELEAIREELRQSVALSSQRANDYIVMLDRAQRAERRVTELEHALSTWQANYERARDNATSRACALRNAESVARELLSRATAAEDRVKELEVIMECENQEVLRYFKHIEGQKGTP